MVCLRQHIIQPKERTNEQSVGHGARGGRAGGTGECHDRILRNDFGSKLTEGTFQVLGQIGLHEGRPAARSLSPSTQVHSSWFEPFSRGTRLRSPASILFHGPIQQRPVDDDTKAWRRQFAYHIGKTRRRRCSRAGHLAGAGATRHGCNLAAHVLRLTQRQPIVEGANAPTTVNRSG